jgi:hypothetical protein
VNAGHELSSRTARALFAVAIASSLVLAIASPARADASTDAEACFLSNINAARSSSGAPALHSDAALAGYARVHSQAMAAQGSIYHSSTADLTPYLPSDWKMWGENVGVGGTCAALFDAFMGSPPHKQNLLNADFQYVGIGVFIDGAGTMWTTHVFLQRAAVPTTTTTTAPPTTTTSAPPTTTSAPPTTTSAPPTTTTTSAPPTPTTTPTAPPTTTTTPATTTTTELVAAPTTTTTTAGGAIALSTPSSPNGVLASALHSWESHGVLCSDTSCGGDQLLLAFIGALLLGGSAVTTWALRG